MNFVLSAIGIRTVIEYDDDVDTVTSLSIFQKICNNRPQNLLGFCLFRSVSVCLSNHIVTHTQHTHVHTISLKKIENPRMK